jgi:hypothetical protein
MADFCHSILCFYLDISADIVVYRFSPTKTNEYLRTKVAHLETCAALESRTIVRELAKDGLMEDGQEDLLRRTLIPALSLPSSHHFRQWAGFVHVVTSSPSIYRGTFGTNSWPPTSKSRNYFAN